jgi:hypothetical protein
MLFFYSSKFVLSPPFRRTIYSEKNGSLPIKKVGGIAREDQVVVGAGDHLHDLRRLPPVPVFCVADDVQRAVAAAIQAPVVEFIGFHFGTVNGLILIFLFFNYLKKRGFE